MALDELYKEVILDHYKNPRNKREMPDAELSCSKNNPLCGDEITVFVHEDDGKLLDVSFLGQGCSISQSSASMMTEAAAGETRGEVERIGERPMRATTATAANSGRQKRPRVRQQMDLFDSARPESGGAPHWPELPEQARSALTDLMARLILAHAATAVPLPAREAGDDL